MFGICFLLFLTIPLNFFLFSLVLINQTAWLTIPAYPSLMCFFLTRATWKKLILQKLVCDRYVCMFCFIFVFGKPGLLVGKRARLVIERL